jgi:hypothetical protein
MPAKRFLSGDLSVAVKYNDRGFYTARVCDRVERRCETVKVGEPKRLKYAVDSARAMHDAAHAAISFSKLSAGAATNPRGSGYALRKPRRRRRG